MTRREQCRAAQKRYEQTAKGKATKRRYERAEKGRAATGRYTQTDKGRAAKRRSDARRIFLGHRYLGHAATIEQAQQINAYIKRRRSAFQRQQSGKEAEGASAG